MTLLKELMQARGLVARPQQKKLVKIALHNDSVVFIQSGTGTGKSYAVLAAALELSRASELPAVVVCANNTLVDQYVKKDMLAVREALGGQFASIKGRTHYACAQSEAAQSLPKEARDALFEKVFEEAESLEWAELGFTPDFACPGSKDCDGYGCGAVVARHRAALADVVLTNAHVLMWDLIVQRFTGGGVSLLPEACCLFVDECHELESTARDCLSEEIRPGSRIYDLLPGLADWRSGKAVELKRRKKRECLFEVDTVIGTQVALAQDLMDQLRPQIDFDRRAKRDYNRLVTFLDMVEQENRSFLKLLQLDGDKLFIRSRCVNASSQLKVILGRQPAVLVSGTIPQSLPARCGVPDATIYDLGHPFDYSKSQLVISNKSGAAAAGFELERARQVAAAINDSKGGTLVLFTSWQDLDNVTEVVISQLEGDPPIFVQHRTDREDTANMIGCFINSSNGVLVGTKSLFTGLDIPGDALRQVVIWKLPYAVPTLEVQAVKDAFGYQAYLDEMLMVLAQAAGRLVRTQTDSGRIFIVDSRAKQFNWRRYRVTKHLSEFGGQ